MQNRKKIILLITLALMAVALPASAALPEIIPTCAKGTTVPPLSCFLTLLGNVSKWILGISGSIALAMFVYGGFMMMASGGVPDKVNKGKTILTQAVIGLIIIFGAYFAVDFLTKALGFKESKFEIPKETTSSKTDTTKSGTSGTVSTPSTAYKCSCVCSNGYKESITNGTLSYTAIAQCQALCIIQGKGITMTSCK